jgi:phosphotransferase system HPr (HPr) family protein
MSESIARRTLVVTDPAGVHARTAVAIAEVARRGSAAVTLIKDGQRVSATDVLQIMTMVAAQGDRIEIEATGADAEATIDALEPLFGGHFGDERQETA